MDTHQGTAEPAESLSALYSGDISNRDYIEDEDVSAVDADSREQGILGY